MRRSLPIAAAVLSAVLLAACGSSSEDSTSPAPDYKPALENAPPPLADLYANGSDLIDGGEDAYEETIASLEGYPIVVNNWASWCGPCREEWPDFQAQAAERLDEVAFLGVLSEDSSEAAETYLEGNPVPYPSIEAPTKGDFGKWADTAVVAIPNTIFYNAEGELVYTHQGPYTSEEDLAADIDEYAVGS